MKVKRSVINAVTEGRKQGVPDQQILSVMERKGMAPDFVSRAKQALDKPSASLGRLYTPSDAIDMLLKLPGDQVEEDAQVAPVTPGRENAPETRGLSGQVGLGRMAYDPSLQRVAKNVSREVVSQVAGGMAGGASIMGGPAGAALSPIARGATYYGVNRALGGDPSAMDVIGAGAGGVGDIFSQGGIAAKIVSRAPSLEGVESMIAPTAQAMTDVALTFPEDMPLWQRGVVGGISALGQKAGDVLTPTSSAAPRPVQEAAQALDIGTLPSEPTALTAYMGSDLLGAKSRVNAALDKFTASVGAKGPGSYDADAANVAISSALTELQASKKMLNQKNLMTLQQTLNKMAQTNPEQLPGAIRNLIAAAPPTASVEEVRPLIAKLGQGEGLEPWATPEALGKQIQGLLKPRLEAQKKAAGEAYRTVFDPLASSKALAEPTDVEELIGPFKSELATVLPSAAKFYNPAARDAAALAKQGVADVAEGKRILLPDGTLSGSEQTPVEVTLGNVSQAIKDATMELTSMPKTEANASRRWALWELRSRLNDLGDRTVARLKQVDPLNKAINDWESYSNVRAQYRNAMEDIRAYDELPEHPTKLGLKLAEGRSAAQPNPALDVLDRFFGKGAVEPSAKEAAISKATLKPAEMDQFTSGDIEALKQVPWIKPDEARAVDQFVREQRARELPETPEKLLQVLLPHKAAESSAPLKLTPEATERAWRGLNSLPTPEADNIRNSAIRQVFNDSMNPDDTFDANKFNQILQANADALPPDVTTQLVSLQSKVFGDGSLLEMAPPELDRAIKVFENTRSMKSFLDAWNSEMVARPETARFIVQKLEKSSPPTLNLLREQMVANLFQSQASDPAERLLDIAKRVKEVPAQALEILLDPEAMKRLRDVETVVDYMAPALNTAVRQRKGSASSFLGSQERQFWSTSSYLKMILLGTGAGLLGTGASPALILPSAAVLLAVPKISAAGILNPSNPLAKTFSNAAQVITRGATAGTKELVGATPEKKQ